MQKNKQKSHQSGWLWSPLRKHHKKATWQCSKNTINNVEHRRKQTQRRKHHEHAMNNYITLWWSSTSPMLTRQSMSMTKHGYIQAEYRNIKQHNLSSMSPMLPMQIVGIIQVSVAAATTAVWLKVKWSKNRRGVETCSEWRVKWSNYTKPVSAWKSKQEWSGNASSN